MTKLRAHPAAELFPMMPEEDLADLAEDIKANGQRHPIVVIDGGGEWLILDGRNRYEACRIAGVTPSQTVWSGTDPIAFVLSLNLHRRHLTESQRAMVAAKIANLRKGGDRGNQHTGGKGPTGPLATSVSDAASQLQVGERSVKRGRVVLEHGAPEVVAAVESGKVSVADAASVAKLPKDEQRERLARVESGLSRTMRDASYYDPGDDDDATAVVADVEDDPIPPEGDTPRRWGDFEMSSTVARLIGECRAFESAVATIFDSVDPARRDEFASRAESSLLRLFDSIRSRLPVTARRAEENRSRMRVLDGGK
jgi:hypothetical protein